MSIKKSEIISNNLQAHGESYVIEEHTDHIDRKHRFLYSAIKPDVKTILNNRTVKLNEVLILREIEEVLYKIENGKKVDTLNFCTWDAVKLKSIEHKEKIEKELLEVSTKKMNIKNDVNLKENK